MTTEQRDPFETAPDIESSILTGVLANPDELINCITLSPDCFEKPDNALIFKAIQDLAAKNERVNSTSVIQELTASGLGDVALSVKFLASEPKPASVETAVRVVTDTYYIKVINNQLEEIIQSGGSPTEKLNLLAEIPTLVSTGNNDGSIHRGSDFLKGAANKYLERNSTDTHSEIQYGYPRLENNLPLSKGAGVYSIIAARPHVGKTAFALSMALNIARAGNKAAFISLEMGDMGIEQRLLTMLEGVATTKLNRYKALQDSDIEAIQGVAAGKHANLLENFITCFPENKDIGSIERLCWKLKAEGVEVIFIDQLSNIGNNSRGAENDTVRFSLNSQRIQSLVGKLKMPVFLLAQLNRGAEQRTNGAPMLSDLKQSGSLEENCDCCFLLHSPASQYEGKEGAAELVEQTQGMLTINLAKNRVGGRVFEDKYYRFSHETATVTEGPYGVSIQEEKAPFKDEGNDFDGTAPESHAIRAELQSDNIRLF